MRYFCQDNIVFSEAELVLSVKYDDIITFVDAFYAVKMEWEDYLILNAKTKKVKIGLNKSSKLNKIFEKNGCLFIYLSDNNIDYIIANLMRFHHFKKMPVSHIHVGDVIERVDNSILKEPKSFDLTIMFED